MTTVIGKRRRSVGPDTFADITTAAVTRIDSEGVTFDATLTAAQVDAVWSRMESTDDIDQAKRAQLRTDRDALAAADPLRRLYNYMLGD